MKRPLAFILGLFVILCSGCAAAKADRITIESPEQYSQSTGTKDPSTASELFFSTLELDKEKGYIYPDTYGGMYVDGSTLVFLVAGDDFSEYQYLKDAYSDVEFKSVEYSWNYLSKLRDEYFETYDRSVDTVYMGYVDVNLNRAVITVNEETLARKTFDENSPLIFKIGSPTYLL